VPDHMQLTLEENPSQQDIQILVDGISAHAKQIRGLEPIQSHAIWIRDQDNMIHGGCSFCNFYGCLYIDNLWVEESLRGKGYGTKLMMSAEKFGKEHGCHFATVNTMDWEALDFYKKLGFQVEFARRGFLKESVFYFLRKELLCISKQKIEFNSLCKNDISEIVSAFSKIGWNKRTTIYESYLREQISNQRIILIAKDNHQFCGYVTLKWQSNYPSFNNNHIPEITDLNVLPHFRKQGIGTMLIKQCEQIARDRGYKEIGIGVGMTQDYGNAQRLYVHLGFIPDGNGLYHHYSQINYADTITVNDDLVLYLKKDL
jgi:ribosomal protein S18 acetylase RimI-like enzyme